MVANIVGAPWAERDGNVCVLRLVSEIQPRAGALGSWCARSGVGCRL